MDTHDRDTLQMTRGNVGSLLVFDPAKIDLAPTEASTMKSAHEDAVVGIVTERGTFAMLENITEIGRISCCAGVVVLTV